MKDFAKDLKYLRLETKLTQTQFTAKLNIDTAALSKIENGKKDFDPKKIETLTNEFDLTVEEVKSRYFGEKIALELYTNNCPIITFKIAEKKFRYFEENA